MGKLYERKILFSPMLALYKNPSSFLLLFIALHIDKMKIFFLQKMTSFLNFEITFFSIIYYNIVI